MSMTPTPWHWQKTSADQYLISSEANGKTVAVVYTTEADAKRITAAVNAYDELVAALDEVSTARAKQDHEFDVTAWFKRIRSTLATLKEEA